MEKTSTMNDFWCHASNHASWQLS